MKIKTSTKFVVAAVIAIMLFTVASFIILSISGQNISDALTVAYFSFWTAEIVSLASIKNTKTRKRKKKEGNNDESDITDNT